MGFLTKKQENQIKIFAQKILKKNKQINLVSRKNPEEQIRKLLKESKDSIEVLKRFFKKKNQKILDIGSGNGFPGLFFAILFPDNHFYLCERRRKKAEAIKWISSECRLSNTQVLCQAAESLKPDYDIILSQAGMPPKKIEKLLKSFLKQQATAFLWVSEKQLPSFHSSFHKEKLPFFNGKKMILKLYLK